MFKNPIMANVVENTVKKKIDLEILYKKHPKFLALKRNFGCYLLLHETVIFRSKY